MKSVEDEVNKNWEEVFYPEEKTYTEKELLEAEERAFNAARYVTPDPTLTLQSHYTYPTFSEYKNSNK